MRLRRWIPLVVMLLAAAAASGCAAQLGNGTRTVQVLQMKTRAEQAYAAGDRATALASYEAYVRAMPEDAAAWTRIGNLHLMANEPEPAEQAYRRALEINRGDTEALHNLALIRLRQAHATMQAEYGMLPPQSPQARQLACRLAWLAVLEKDSNGKQPECTP